VSQSLSIIRDNLARVRERIDQSARRCGRTGSDVCLVAVTKYVSNDVAAAVVSAGCGDLGESRPQELWQKHEALSALDVRWHFIGHLQRNKVRRTLPMVGLLHSADSMRLIEELNQECVRLQRRLPVLLEVNISGEQAKHGFSPDELENTLPSIAELSNIEVRGLMAMAGLEGDLDDARREFRAVRVLRDRLTKVTPLKELSMGMSGDFEVAIEEGATIVRVGSALFEGLP
jgi:pyridoxal phosphate enzyme (YggS family)